jgi:hypothetical protein
LEIRWRADGTPEKTRTSPLLGKLRCKLGRCGIKLRTASALLWQPLAEVVKTSLP